MIEQLPAASGVTVAEFVRKFTERPTIPVQLAPLTLFTPPFACEKFTTPGVTPAAAVPRKFSDVGASTTGPGGALGVGVGELGGGVMIPIGVGVGVGDGVGVFGGGVGDGVGVGGSTSLNASV